MSFQFKVLVYNTLTVSAVISCYYRLVIVVNPYTGDFNSKFIRSQFSVLNRSESTQLRQYFENSDLSR